VKNFTSLKKNGGKMEAVLNVKDVPDRLVKAVVADYERGLTADIMKYPWQSETCIGAWHYLHFLYEKPGEYGGYQNPREVIHWLIDSAECCKTRSIRAGKRGTARRRPLPPLCATGPFKSTKVRGRSLKAQFSVGLALVQHSSWPGQHESLTEVFGWMWLLPLDIKLETIG
jgi:hypothetical protein